MPKTSAKMRKQQQPRKTIQISLDSNSQERRKGRPLKIQPIWVRGRADNYRYIFGLIWKHIWPGLSKAKTRQDILKSFNETEIRAYALDFITLADLMLQVLQDSRFPKRKREAQINFLADSIAAHGTLTPRSSRDVCERERARIKQAHRILCYEFYIECSCGYKRNHGCPKCEAKIVFDVSPPDVDTILHFLPRT
jgi:hypothetical protein